MSVEAFAPDGSDWRPAPLLPGRDGGWALGFVMAVLCGLACLTVIAASASARAAAGWEGDLRASATVQVRPRAGETAGEAAARAAEVLAGVRGVSEAAALDRAAAQKLLEPWLGKGDLPDDLPIPRLVTVSLDPRTPATADTLNAALRQAGLDGAVDDHGRWLKDLERAGSQARAAAVGLAGLMGAAAIAAIAFATRAGLAARREVVEVLSLSGASDRFIAGLFERRFAVLAGAAALAGAVGAAALAGGLKAAGGQDGFTPVLPLAWADLLWAAPAPLLAAVVGGFTARRTALRYLRAAP